MNISVIAIPGKLLFCISAGISFDEPDSLFPVKLAIKVIEPLLVPYRILGIQVA